MPAPNQQILNFIGKLPEDTDDQIMRQLCGLFKLKKEQAQQALEFIGKLPEDTDQDEIMYQLYVFLKIIKGQEAAAHGQTITSEALKREIDSW